MKKKEMECGKHVSLIGRDVALLSCAVQIDRHHDDGESMVDVGIAKGKKYVAGVLDKQRKPSWESKWGRCCRNSPRH